MGNDELCCENCKVYRIKFNMEAPVECHRCGHTTMEWKLHEDGWTIYLKCSNCRAYMWTDMNMPCEKEYYKGFENTDKESRHTAKLRDMESKFVFAPCCKYSFRPMNRDKYE